MGQLKQALGAGVRRLQDPAPVRCYTRTGRTEQDDASIISGELTPRITLRPAREVEMYASRSWGEADIMRHVSAGGWFNIPATQFESQAAALFARHAQDTWAALAQGEV